TLAAPAPVPSPGPERSQHPTPSPGPATTAPTPVPSLARPDRPVLAQRATRSSGAPLGSSQPGPSQHGPWQPGPSGPGAFPPGSRADVAPGPTARSAATQATAVRVRWQPVHDESGPPTRAVQRASGATGASGAVRARVPDPAGRAEGHGPTVA